MWENLKKEKPKKVIKQKNYNKKEKKYMKIKVFQRTVLLTSTIKHSELVELQYSDPKSLALFDLEDNELFRVFASEVGAINSFGVAFNGYDEEGFATCSFELTENIVLDQRKDFLSRTLGTPLENLKILETSIPVAYQTLQDSINKVSEYIEILG